MEARNSLTNIAQNETIKHQGDLTIEGDVEENAQIIVQDGSLTILGNVHEGARIEVNVSKSLEHLLSPSVTTSSSTIFQINDRVIICASSWGSKLMGPVSIDNRIFTEDDVMMVDGLSGNRMKIHPSDHDATVIVDGVEYTGKKIKIDEKNVYVDGTKASNKEKPVNVAHRPKKPKGPLKLFIHGEVENHVSIKSDADMEVKGKIGDFCQLVSKRAGLKAKDIGQGTTIDVCKEIVVAAVKRDCILKSNLGGLTACDIDESVTISVRQHIKVNNVGSQSSFNSCYNGFNGNNIGDNVKINTSQAIQLNNADRDCEIISRYSGVIINGDIGPQVTVQASQKIEVKNKVGDASSLLSEYGEIKIHGRTGDNVKLNAAQLIDVNQVGDANHLFSGYGGIRIRGNAGDKTTAKASSFIHAQDIGKNSTINSSYDGVSAQNVGSHTTITSSGDINIEGSCPSNVTTRSSYGKVRKASPQKASKQHVADTQKSDSDYVLVYAEELYNPPKEVETEEEQAADTDDFDADLEYILALSLAEQESLKSVGNCKDKNEKCKDEPETVDVDQKGLLEKQSLFSKAGKSPEMKKAKTEKQEKAPLHRNAN